MRGQVLFFDANKNFGVIVAEAGEEHFLSGSDLAERVILHDWVMFDSERNVRAGSKNAFAAKNVHRIECPPEHLLQCTVTKWFADKAYGFISYEQNGQAYSVFCHANEFIERPIEGRDIAGLYVSFCLGRRDAKIAATQIRNLAEWPEPNLDFERYFEEAPELRLEYAPALVATNPISSVLAPTTRKLSMLEIRQRRKQEKS
jgi:cold shock CspA family protein